MTEEADLKQSQLFRPAKKLKWGGFFLVIFFLAVYPWFLWMAIANPDGSIHNPLAFVIIDTVFFGGFGLVSLYVLQTYRRLRITVEGKMMTYRSAFNEKQIQLENVQLLRWRSIPAGGSVVIEADTSRIKIEFGNFQERNRLIEFMRTWVPLQYQQNFESFSARYFGPKQTPPSVRPSKTLIIALIMLAASIGIRMSWHHLLVRELASIPCMFSPCIALLAILDSIRLRSPKAGLAAIVASIATFLIFQPLWRS